MGYGLCDAQVLYLNGNYLTSLDDLEQQPRLKDLHLENNRLSSFDGATPQYQVCCNGIIMMIIIMIPGLLQWYPSLYVAGFAVWYAATVCSMLLPYDFLSIDFGKPFVVILPSSRGSGSETTLSRSTSCTRSCAS